MASKKTVSKKSLSKISWRRYGAAVIGVDEVGRGCLAGPVGAAACLFVKGDLERSLTDSKALNESQRDHFYALIEETHPVAYATASVNEIDEINIFHASMLAMRRAIEALGESLRGTELEEAYRSAVVVVDGSFRIPGLAAFRQETLVKGDLRCAPISAASIYAKVSRDRTMKQLALEHPVYGFEIHKGYATPQHRQAIAAHGPCVWHRRSFAGTGGPDQLVFDVDVAAVEIAALNP